MRSLKPTELKKYCVARIRKTKICAQIFFFASKSTLLVLETTEHLELVERMHAQPVPYFFDLYFGAIGKVYENRFWLFTDRFSLSFNDFKGGEGAVADDFKTAPITRELDQLNHSPNPAQLD